ncbi:MAG TPA: hypothetical protein VII99_03850 [Bacteroidia bacterium]
MKTFLRQIIFLFFIVLWNSVGLKATVFINEPFNTSLNGWTTVVGSGDVVGVTATANAGGTADEVTFTGNSKTAL